jgi:hypothetical protein
MSCSLNEVPEFWDNVMNYHVARLYCLNRVLLFISEDWPFRIWHDALTVAYPSEDSKLSLIQSGIVCSEETIEMFCNSYLILI